MTIQVYHIQDGTVSIIIPPEIGSIKFYGLSEKEVIANDIRKTYEFKI